MLLALLLSLAPAAFPQTGAEGATPRLATEDLEGRRGLLDPADLPLADPRTKGVWIVRPEGFALPPAADDPAPRMRLTLVGGDVLGGRVRGGSGEVLELELAGGVVVPVAIDDLASLVALEGVPEAALATFTPAPEGDRLYRLTGAIEPVDGTVEGFAADGVRFDSVLGSRTTPWAEVAALFVESLSGATAPVAAEVPVQLTFAGTAGGRLRAGLVRLEREHCRVVLGGRTEVALPLGALSELLVADGRLSYLSDLAPLAESGRGAPFGDELGMLWPHRRDANVAGGPLVAAGRTYARGLGVHAPSRLTFALDPPARALRGSVAIDDSTRLFPRAARGSVVFRLWADEKLLWESPVVQGGEAPLVLPALALAGARELVLEVDPAGDFAGDRADWLELLLVR
ncbi:MAG TPA: NPCBM/NEW2 domain-containing protein [Planctomycetota bacterium]